MPQRVVIELPLPFAGETGTVVWFNEQAGMGCVKFDKIPASCMFHEHEVRVFDEDEEKC